MSPAGHEEKVLCFHLRSQKYRRGAAAVMQCGDFGFICPLLNKRIIISMDFICQSLWSDFLLSYLWEGLSSEAQAFTWKSWLFVLAWLLIKQMLLWQLRAAASSGNNVLFRRHYRSGRRRIRIRPQSSFLLFIWSFTLCWLKSISECLLFFPAVKISAVLHLADRSESAGLRLQRYVSRCVTYESNDACRQSSSCQGFSSLSLFSTAKPKHCRCL